MTGRTMRAAVSVAFACLIGGSPVARADLRALFYEYEQSDQWYWQLVPPAVKKAAGETVRYVLTTDPQGDLTLANLGSYDMLLFGTHGIGGWGTYHLGGVEQDLIDYVEGGGFILVQTSDDGFYQGGMFPVELAMRESGDHDIEITPEGEAAGIFETPNAIDEIVEDDSYLDVEEPWVVFATSADSDTPHTLSLRHGDGEYLVTSTRGEEEAQAAANVPFVENLITYLAKRVQVARSVDAAGKLALTWGTLRAW